MLSRISLSGFKSIERLEDLELRALNILVGPNGAGKSNFVSFFEMLDQIADETFAKYVQLRGGASNFLHYGPKTTNCIAYSLRFEPEDGRPLTYETELTYADDDTLVFTEEHLQGTDSIGSTSTHSTSRRESELEEFVEHFDLDSVSRLHKLLSECQVYHFHDTTRQAPIRQKTAVDRNRYLFNDGRNLAAVLYRLKCDERAHYDRIVSTIRDVFPQFDDFDLPHPQDDPQHVKLDWREVGREYPLGPSQLSDGTLRFAALATLLFQPEDDLPGLIILDEPELGLHPYAIEKLAALFRHASQHAQLLVATQSPVLVDHFEPEDVVVVERADGCSEFKRLDADELESWLEDYGMGELWEKNVIGGNP